jgi:hypothetical protein
LAAGTAPDYVPLYQNAGSARKTATGDIDEDAFESQARGAAASPNVISLCRWLRDAWAVMKGTTGLQP